MSAIHIGITSKPSSVYLAISGINPTINSQSVHSMSIKFCCKIIFHPHNLLESHFHYTPSPHPSTPAEDSVRCTFFIKRKLAWWRKHPRLIVTKKNSGLYSHRNNDRMRKELELHSENLFGALDFARPETKATVRCSCFYNYEDVQILSNASTLLIFHPLKSRDSLFCAIKSATSSESSPWSTIVISEGRTRNGEDKGSSQQASV